MKIFGDTGNLAELRHLYSMGLLSGITTNPTIASREGKSLTRLLKTLCEKFPDLEICGQVVSTSTEGMIAEARTISAIGKNIVVKIPCTEQAMPAIKALSDEGMKICATAILTAPQAFFCAIAGAAYVAPYTGQNDVIGLRGVDILKQMCDVIHSSGLSTQVLAASVEKPQEVIDYALAGADVVTAPYHAIINAFRYTKPLTDFYVDNFYKDWSSAECEI